jgi:type I restriction enzyme S subunit
MRSRAMAGEYDTVPLGDVASVRSGFAFKSSDWSETGIPVVKIANIKGGNLVMDGCSFVPQAIADSAGEFTLQAGDILIAMTGYIGDVAIVRERDLPAVLNQRVGRFSIRDPLRLDPRFLFYVLRDDDVRKEIESLGYGSAQPNVSPSLIHSVEIPLPPLPEQRAIAHILGTLDDKIELNRRMSQTLEAMARALFKAWFVDFEPVRAKMEGRWQRGGGANHDSPLQPGLPAHLYDLFPDRLVDSELGEIPEGWEVGCVDDEFDLTMGQSPPGHTYNEVGDGLPFYQGRTDFGFRFPTRRVYCTTPTRLAKKGDTLISVRAPVGDVNMAAEDCAIGRGVAAARHKTGSRSYTYQFMLAQADVFARFEAEGTVFGSISKKDFHAIACVVPPRGLVEEFERRVAPLDGRIEVTERESRTLAALRDALLPKLISGELGVKDAERFLKERGL